MVTDTFEVQTTIPAGQPFAFGLPSRPSTGYHWTFTGADGLGLRESFLPTLGGAADPAAGPLIGAGGLQLFTVQPPRAGDYVLQFTYNRAWESAPPVATARVTLRVLAP